MQWVRLVRILTFPVGALGLICLICGIDLLKRKKRVGLVLLMLCPFFAVGSYWIYHQSEQLEKAFKHRGNDMLAFAEKLEANFMDELTQYQGDLGFRGDNIGKAIVIQFSASGDKISSQSLTDDYNRYLPRNYRAEDLKDLHSLILVQEIHEQVGTYSDEFRSPAYQRNYFFYVVDKKTGRVVARQAVRLEPAESRTVDGNYVFDDYHRETKLKNDQQLRLEKDFFKRLYLSAWPLF